MASWHSSERNIQIHRKPVWVLCFFGPVEGVPVSIYQQINGEIVRYATLRTEGSGGPSGVDANGFQRILASNVFKKSGTDLCAAIAAMTRRLCTEFIDPLGIEAILANRLIPPRQRRGRCLADRCRRSCMEDNRKVCNARGKARCH